MSKAGVVYCECFDFPTTMLQAAQSVFMGRLFETPTVIYT